MLQIAVCCSVHDSHPSVSRCIVGPHFIPFFSELVCFFSLCVTFSFCFDPFHNFDWIFLSFVLIVSFSFALVSDFKAMGDSWYARSTIQWSAFECASTQKHSDDGRYRQSWSCGFGEKVKRKETTEKQSSGALEMMFLSWIPTAFRCVPAQRALNPVCTALSWCDAISLLPPTLTIWMSWYKLDGVVMLRRTMSLHTIPIFGRRGQSFPTKVKEREEERQERESEREREAWLAKNEKKISRAITNWYNLWERLWRKSFSAFLVQFHLRVAFIYFTLSYILRFLFSSFLSSLILFFFSFFFFSLPKSSQSTQRATQTIISLFFFCFDANRLASFRSLHSAHGRFLFDVGKLVFQLDQCCVHQFCPSVAHRIENERWNEIGIEIAPERCFLSSAPKSNRNWNRWKIF